MLTRAQLGHPARRLQGVVRLERRLADLERQLAAFEARADARNTTLAAALAERIDARSAELSAALQATHGLIDGDIRSALLSVAAEDAENRRRLWSLRRSDEYERAFQQPEPLVSITVPTYARTSILTYRTLPSLLNQTYSNIEIVVVGDHDGPEVAEAVAALGDERISYRNLTQRLPPDRDPRRAWLVGSTLARNEASRYARGDWMVAFDDDDAMAPGMVESLLAAARERRTEVAYGRVRTHLKGDGADIVLGEFPPRREQFSWIGALYHAGLGFFERELVAAHFDTSGDWFLLERMLRTGVRFGMIDEVVADYFPSSQR